MVIQRTQKEIRQRAPVWLIGLLFLNLGLMSFEARDQVTKQRIVRVWTHALVGWFQRPVTSAGGASLGFFQRLGNSWVASGENERLKRRLAELEGELREIQMARDENERLKGLLSLKQESKYGVVPASVIARDPSGWFSSVLINRGTSSGVQLNMPVVTPDGIVGRVVGVSPWTAQVMVLTDEKAAAGAVVGQLGASGAIGVVLGTGKSGMLKMDYVSGLEQVNVGDGVVTTGQDGIYPPGLSVGSVVEKRSGSATMEHEIGVKPSARLDSLKEVAVLQYQPSPRTLPKDALPNVKKSSDE